MRAFTWAFAVYAAFAVLGASALGGKTLQCTGCAKVGDVCCLCTSVTHRPICLWNDKYCESSLFCDDKTNLCSATPPAVDTQSADCGKAGSPCCDIVTRVGGPIQEPCLGKNLCSSGTCIDPTAPVLIEQADACIGEWNDCDENYVCVTRGGGKVCVPG